MSAALQISHPVFDFDQPMHAGARIARCGAASLATGLLVALSWLNAFHSPAFDCIRAGANAARNRRALCAATLRAEAPPASQLARLVSRTTPA